jgi:dnd system-associated protein 4
MAYKIEKTKRDRVYVEKSQISTYRELAGIGASKSKKTHGAELPPFEDLKNVFMAAVCLGVKIGRRTTLKEKMELTRTSYFSENMEIATFRAIAIAETKIIEIISDENQMMNIAEEYANTGFEDLKRRITETGLPLMNLASLLTEEIDYIYN